ncbi:MAG: signal peptide peptidase SppA [Phycisphaeraceae bacterium]|nr:signal peptide peptidase SppA [Phycisphaeraceae bacterium]
MNRTLHFLTVMIAMAVTGCMPVSVTIGGNPERQELRAKIVQKADRPTRDDAAIIDITGLIYNAHKPQLLGRGENPVALLHEQLEAARKDRRVRAVLLRINSPGGSVAASDAMYRMILRFKAEARKPVVALLTDTAASGGFYVACAADKTIAYPTCVTGSIGVLIQLVSVKPALNWLGVVADAVTSGPNKDAGSPFSTLSEEQRKIFQQIVDEFHGNFVGVVRLARPNLTPEHLAPLTDGRIMTGADAAERGLIDRTGDLRDAYEEAIRLAGIDRANLVIYHRPMQYVGSPYAAAPAVVPQAGSPEAGSSLAGAGAIPGEGTQVNVAQFNFTDSPGMQAGFYYLWSPGVR